MPVFQSNPSTLRQFLAATWPTNTGEPSPHVHAYLLRILAPDTPPTGARAAVPSSSPRELQASSIGPSVVALSKPPPALSNRCTAPPPSLSSERKPPPSSPNRLCPALECLSSRLPAPSAWSLTLQTS